MQQQLPIIHNRIAKDMSAWERVEDKLAERYGKKILHDPDFLKAKRDIYQHIQGKHKGKTLNLYEKAEMRILRSQQRNMLRQVYPNPTVRLLRNLVVFAGNLIALPAKVGMTMLGFSKQNPAYVSHKNDQRQRSQIAPRQQEKNKEQPPAHKMNQQRKKPDAQTQSLVRKMPMKARVAMPLTKGVRR